MDDDKDEKIGALWEERNDRGQEWMTGEISGVKVVCFRNTKTDNPKAPQWRVLKRRARQTTTSTDW